MTKINIEVEKTTLRFKYDNKYYIFASAYITSEVVHKTLEKPYNTDGISMHDTVHSIYIERNNEVSKLDFIRYVGIDVDIVKENTWEKLIDIIDEMYTRNCLSELVGGVKDTYSIVVKGNVEDTDDWIKIGAYFGSEGMKEPVEWVPFRYTTDIGIGCNTIKFGTKDLVNKSVCKLSGLINCVKVDSDYMARMMIDTVENVESIFGTLPILSDNKLDYKFKRLGYLDANITTFRTNSIIFEDTCTLPTFGDNEYKLCSNTGKIRLCKSMMNSIINKDGLTYIHNIPSVNTVILPRGYDIDNHYMRHCIFGEEKYVQIIAE